MALYKWDGIDLQGKKHSGILETRSIEALKENLLNNNIALISCKIYKQNKILSLFNNLFFPYTFKQEEIIPFFESLSLLLTSGLDLITTLECVKKQFKSQKQQNIISNIINSLNSGNSFSQTLLFYKTHFPTIVIPLIHAGEKSGTLAPTLNQLALYLKQQNNIKKSIIQAALFPLITLGFAIIIILSIIIWLIPQVTTVFSFSEQKLPASIEILIGTSNFIRSYSCLFLVISIFMFFLFLKILLKNPKIQEIKDQIIFNLPLCHTIISLLNTIYFLRTLTLTISSGIPLKDALIIARQTIANKTLNLECEKLEREIITGKSLSFAVNNINKIPYKEILVNLIELGEASGNLDKTLESACDFYTKELSKRLSLITTLLQPILLIIVGIIIAALMVIIYLPLFNRALLFQY
jgi:type II secretory pathway component PulF